MSQKYKKYTGRIEDLIIEFNEKILPNREKANSIDHDYRYPENVYDLIRSWLIRVQNILNIIFSDNSIQYKEFMSLKEKLDKSSEQRLRQIRGLLEGCLEDLSNGFVLGHEFVIANEVFDSVLEEAKFFIYEQKNKDIGAILLRIVLEDSLRRIARKEEIPTTEEDGKSKKAAFLNEELKRKDFYNQTVWRQVSTWLDLGNDAAHGHFDKYDYEQVRLFYEGLNNFIASYFKD